MKKLMIAAAVVCAATLSQAAAFTWSTSDTAYMPFTRTKIVEGTSAAATSGSTKTIESWADNGATFAYTMLINGEESTGSLAFDSGAIVVNANNAGFVLPTAGEKLIEWDIVISGTYTDSADKEWSFVSDHITGSATYTSLSTAAIDTGVPTEWTFSSVPEPTSGLLLLLGVAGLALRRRRA